MTGRGAQAIHMRLSQLLPVSFDAGLDCDVSGLALDSRQVRPGDVFIALGGSRVAGQDFVHEAVAAGAVAVVTDRPLVDSVAVPVVVVDQLAGQLGDIASRFYHHPSRELRITGITGTNGKTSCSLFLAQALDSRPGGCGVIGTLGMGRYGALTTTTHTTPDAISIQRQLRTFRQAGIDDVVMEVSSHALEQGRVNGIDFDAAIFTNLSHDHLDYHGDMAAYGQAKKRLFEAPSLRYAVINAGDTYGASLLAALPSRVQTVSYQLLNDQQAVAPGADVRGRIQQMGSHGMTLCIESPWGQGCLSSTLLGRFNAENLLAVLATLVQLGVSFDEALQRIAATKAVPGRMEHFGGADGQPLVVVDYAHSPDALQQVLRTLREHCQRDLLCVFGCGGDRDRGKRPLMGQIAERWADRVIITDDNPRSESSTGIIADILAGLAQAEHVEVIADRAQAIVWAIGQAREGDVVLIAGKGHEDYQIIGEQRQPFSDREQVMSVLQESGHG